MTQWHSFVTPPPPPSLGLLTSLSLPVCIPVCVSACLSVSVCVCLPSRSLPVCLYTCLSFYSFPHSEPINRLTSAVNQLISQLISLSIECLPSSFPSSGPRNQPTGTLISLSVSPSTDCRQSSSPLHYKPADRYFHQSISFTLYRMPVLLSPSSFPALGGYEFIRNCYLVNLASHQPLYVVSSGTLPVSKQPFPLPPFLSFPLPSCSVSHTCSSRVFRCEIYRIPAVLVAACASRVGL